MLKRDSRKRSLVGRTFATWALPARARRAGRRRCAFSDPAAGAGRTAAAPAFANEADAVGAFHVLPFGGDRFENRIFAALLVRAQRIVPQKTAVVTAADRRHGQAADVGAAGGRGPV